MMPRIAPTKKPPIPKKLINEKTSMRTPQVVLSAGLDLSIIAEIRTMTAEASPRNTIAPKAKKGHPYIIMNINLGLTGYTAKRGIIAMRRRLFISIRIPAISDSVYAAFG